MKSILQNDPSHCFLCGRTDHLEKHHCMSGTANRRLAEADGLYVWLCPECHRTGKNSAHNNIVVNLALKEHAQRVWEATYGSREDFMKRYGKNYIEGDGT